MALSSVGIQIIYILQFFIGYFLFKLDIKETQNKWVSKKAFVFLTVASVVLAGIRLITNRYIDGTVLYDRIIARWSFSIIAIWLIAILVYVCRSVWVEKLVKSKVWKILDITSYPLFLTHYMFLTGPMKVMNWFKGVPLQLIMFTLLTFTSAAIITLITSGKSLRNTIIEK